MTARDGSLRERQPWKAARELDYAWLGEAITKHYHGDDSDVKVLMGGVLQAFRGWAVEDYQAAAENYLHRTQHPALGRGFCDCSYRPMVELLRYLEANGFTTYITSGATAISCGPSPRSTTTPPARRNCSSEQEHRDGR